MKHMRIAQSGGPSAAINATVAGVVERCMTSDKVDRIDGDVYKRQGLLMAHQEIVPDLTPLLHQYRKKSWLFNKPALF